MSWKFHSSEDDRYLVEVRWTPTGNLPARLKEFRQSATGSSTYDIYARATFLKYHALVEDFAVVAKSYKEWLASRQEGKECFALLEAFAPNSDETAGTLLVRSAWNGDAVIDLLVTNPHMTTEIPGVGIMLVSAACGIARESRAPLIFVETARHSAGYWEKFLQQGNPFLRFDSAEVAFARAEVILTGGKVRHVHSDEQ